MLRLGGIVKIYDCSRGKRTGGKKWGRGGGELENELWQEVKFSGDVHLLYNKVVV